jgi:LytS/YehU family sensor histidine kinase
MYRPTAGVQPLATSIVSNVLRVLVYAGVGATVVLGIGRALPDLVGAGTTFLTTKPSLAVCVALFWVGGWGLARDIDLEEHLRQERARGEALEREAEHAQLIALRSHLDPHFLFNTLNAIAEWCREDGAVAEKAIVQLSSMLRTMMTGIQSTTWPLAKELELASALFTMHAIRDPSMFTVRLEVPDPVPEVDVPPMLLLPLAENAMKHGPLARHKGEVVLSVTVVREVVRIELSNPGRFAGPRDGGNGLAIVKRRLALAFEEGASFLIEADGDERTHAVVVVPKRLTSSAAAGPSER